MYVAQNGSIQKNQRPNSGYYIEVIGSPQVSHTGLLTATELVGKILRHSPSVIFNNIAQHPGAGVGVFTAQEKIPVFPEFSHLRNTQECHGRCDGNCQHICTSDGRKYEDIAGLTDVALCRPPIVTPFGNFSTEPLSPRDYDWLVRHTPTHRLTYPPGFQFMYVAQNGNIQENQRPDSGYYIEVIGSPNVSHHDLYYATELVGKMLRHSPDHIFNNIAQKPGAGVGVFTAQEKIPVFPEFSHLRNTPECQGRCDGNCQHTCTSDGRKYEDIAGVTNSRSVVLIDNVLCTAHDPYHGHDNILVHEFGHTVDLHGLNSDERNQVTVAYNNAKATNLWTANSYAMSTRNEYFAEGTGAFFLVNLQSTTGGMTNCPGHQCRNQTEVRNFLKAHDPQLFAIFSHVYTDDHPDIPSNIKICP